jgi:epoxyqueuosine reductase
MVVENLNKKNLSDYIKNEAKELGFYACGISKAQFLKSEAEHVEKWLAKSKHASMYYMERNKDKRYNPALLVDGAKSVISVLYNYYPDKLLPETHGYKISKYAYGKDYHFVLKAKLKALLNKIEKKTGNINARVFVDSAPVLERAWGAKSALGFIGKNTLLINKKGGSFFFLGQIIIDIELYYDESFDEKNYCGSCSACIDACPTDALKPFEVDSNKCISFLTIENKGEISVNFKGKFENYIFGCDICQDVCPWNKRFAFMHDEPAFTPSTELVEMTKSDWESLDKATFKKMFKNTAFERTGYKMLKRNIDFVKES